MSAFEDFVTLELPRRPFTMTDGFPGQFLVRSANPDAVRELAWVDPPTGGAGEASSEITLEAGEPIPIGAPLRANANKLYVAHASNTPIVIGLAKTDAATGFPVTAMVAGRIMVAGFVPGAAYFLGDGTISPVAPASGFVVRVGRAVTEGIFIIQIEMPVLLT